MITRKKITERKVGLYVDMNLIWNLFYLNTFLNVLIQLIIKDIILMTFKNNAFYNTEMNL